MQTILDLQKLEASDDTALAMLSTISEHCM